MSFTEDELEMMVEGLEHYLDYLQHDGEPYTYQKHLMTALDKLQELLGG